ncbi:hypothetical protein DPMN_079615 [Dreissena polymorpha]|uniref:Uncharacterized protein n=1 Tax=Dreissena polymorpha TaxID=45954 RepID=A0A9D3YSI1_DREPO|nr:hypothetical protein DPMN_079615 [Dreissena polymorpha]
MSLPRRYVWKQVSKAVVPRMNFARWLWKDSKETELRAHLYLQNTTPALFAVPVTVYSEMPSRSCMVFVISIQSSAY